MKTENIFLNLKLVFKNLETGFLIKHYVIAIFISLGMISSSHFISLWSSMGMYIYCGIITILFPFSVLLYQSIVKICFGDTVFIVPVLVMGLYWLLKIFVLYAFSIFLGPIALIYFYIKVSKDTKL